MKLIKLARDYDYGQDYYVQALITKRRSLFQGCVSWSECPGWPFLQIQSGYGAMLSIMFSVYKFGITVGFFDRTWKL